MSTKVTLKFKGLCFRLTSDAKKKIPRRNVCFATVHRFQNSLAFFCRKVFVKIKININKEDSRDIYTFFERIYNTKIHRSGLEVYCFINQFSLYCLLNVHVNLQVSPQLGVNVVLYFSCFCLLFSFILFLFYCIIIIILHVHLYVLLMICLFTEEIRISILKANCFVLLLNTLMCACTAYVNQQIFYLLSKSC